MTPDRLKQEVKNLVYELFGHTVVALDVMGWPGDSGNNYVFLAHTQQDNLVVRLSQDESRLQWFLKEQWCTEQARRVGVAAPQILAVGNEVIPYVYVVEEEVQGFPATEYRGDWLLFWEQVGRIARKIHSIETEGVGMCFDWADEARDRLTWRDYLATVLKVGGGARYLSGDRSASADATESGSLYRGDETVACSAAAQSL